MKYEFASPAWLAALHGIVTERVSSEIKAKPDLKWSICEVYLNAPVHLGHEDGRIAWSCVIDGANIDFSLKERDDVQFKLTVDYDAVLPIGRFDSAGDPARANQLNAMVADIVESGKLKMVGEVDSGPQAMTSIHDAIAGLTD